MLSTIRSKLIALVAWICFLALIVGAAGLYGNSQLQTTSNNAAGYGLAAQNQMGTDMLQDNLRGLVEQYMGAVKDNSPPRIAEAVKSLKENAKNIRTEFGKNESSDVLGPTSQAFIARIKPLIETYAKDSEAIANLTTTDAVELEKNRSSFNEKFRVLKKEQAAFHRHLQEEIDETKVKAAAAASSSVYSLLGAIAFAAVTLAVAAFSTYQTISGDLNTLENTIANVNKGDSAARTQMTGQNELGKIGRCFYELLDASFATLEA